MAANSRESEGQEAPGSPDNVDEPEDDVRRKFREALERKRQHTHATAPGARRDGSEKSHGTSQSTGPKMFRRKSD